MEKDEKQSVDHELTSQSMAKAKKETDMSKLSDPEKPLASSAEPVETADTEYQYIRGAKLWLFMASLTLVIFLLMLDMSILVTAIPQITTDFHSLSDVGWYGSAYLLANCALQPLTGKVYSNFDSKHTFLAFFGLFQIGSVLCGAAQSSNMLIVGRVAAGLGASGLTNGALTIIGAAAPMPKRPGKPFALTGVIIAVSQLGLAGGPLIGGALTQYVSWRWCFYINLPAGAISAIFLLLTDIPDRHDKTISKNILSTLSKLDLVGFFLFAPFAIMFFMALEWGGTEYAWKSATVIGLLCGAGGTLVIFAAWEYNIGEEAMIPYSMLRKRVVWSSCLVTCFLFGCMLISSYYLPIYFQAVKDVSPALSGVYILPSILSQMVAGVISGVLVGKLGYYLPWAVASGAAMAIGSGLISTFTPHTSTVEWIIYQILAGIGRGCGLQMPIVAIQNILPPEQMPVGMSLVVFCQSFGGSVFLTFAETIFSHSLVNGLEEYAPTVSAQAVINAGATGIRQVVKPEEVPGVLEAYNLAISRDFYLCAGAAAGAFLFCWGMGWGSIKKKTVTPEASADEKVEISALA